MGDVLQVFGVGGELAEEFPRAFDVAELFLGDGLFLVGAGQLVWAEDAGDGVVADGPGALGLEAFGAAGGLLAEPDDDVFQRGGGLMRAGFGSAAQLGQGGRLAGEMPAQPFADGVAGATELASGGLEAIGRGEGGALLLPPVTIGLDVIEIKVGAVHAGRMTRLAHRGCASSGGGAAAPPCGERSTPSTSPQGGHDLPSFPTVNKISPVFSAIRLNGRLGAAHFSF